MNGIDNENEITDIIITDVVNHDSISIPPKITPIVLFKLTINK